MNLATMDVVLNNNGCLRGIQPSQETVVFLPLWSCRRICYGLIMVFY